MDDLKHEDIQVWFCKVIVRSGELPMGFDSPPRRAAIEAVESYGVEVIGCSSGWGGRIGDAELEVMNAYNTPNSNIKTITRKEW